MHQCTLCRIDGRMQSLASVLSAPSCKPGRWGCPALLVSADHTCYTLLTFQCCILENQLWSPFSYLCPTRVLWIFKGERGSRHNTYHDTQEQNSETSPASYIVQWKLNKNYSTKTYQRVAKLFESFNNSSQLQLSRELELRTSGGKHWLAATI